MSKENPIGSEEFIKLALNVMNFADFNLEELQKEERKEAEFDWMWKESIV